MRSRRRPALRWQAIAGVNLLLFAVLGAPPQGVLAHVDPPGCSNFGLSLKLVRSVTDGHFGNLVTFQARITNSNDADTCNASDIQMQMTLPDGSVQVLENNASLLVGEETALHELLYTISSDDVKTNKITATVTASGSIHGSPGEDPWSVNQSVTISVPPVVAIDGGPTVRTNEITLTMTGTTLDAPAGALVTVTIDGHTETTMVQADGTWSLPLPLPAADGPYTVTAQVTYGDNNASDIANQDLEVDRTPPMLSIDGGPNVVTTITNPTISGTTDAPVGNTVTVTIDGNTETTAVQADETWSLIWPHALALATYTVIASVADDLENTVTATQDLTIALHGPPVAVKDAYTMTRGQTLTVSAAKGILKNDTSPSGDPLTAVLVAGPANGLLTLNPGGSFTYKPNVAFTGIDSFTYKANDGAFDSNVVTVQITVRPPAPSIPINRRPIAQDDAYAITQGESLTIAAADGVLANDSDPDGDHLVARLISHPEHGTLLLSADGSFSYLPYANFVGTDTFTYRAFDGEADSDLVTVTITVTARAPAPKDASITGVLIDAATGRPIANATVALSADFDGNGTIDFARSVTTDASGRYEIAVPHADFTYICQVTTPVQTPNGVINLTTTHPTRVTASGEEQLFHATMKIAGQLLILPAYGSKPLAPNQILAPGQQIEATLINQDGQALPEPVTMQADGRFETELTAIGAYQILFRVLAADGTPLAGTILNTSAVHTGELVLGTAVIDPNGQVTDALTGLPVAGAQVTLYWANTRYNREMGRTPDTAVTLPRLPRFEPAANAVPQMTITGGIYAWMVFPEGDYYIRAEKAGYRPYDSRTEGRNVPAQPGESSRINNGIIHVRDTLVRYDFQLQPIHHLFIRGYPDGTFRPDQSVTRAEVAAIFARLIQPTAVSMPAPPFRDVANDHWARHHIEVVRQHGVMGGNPDGTFRPDAPITRAELASIISRYLRLGGADSNPFADTAGHWAQGAVSGTYQMGIITGFPDGTFRPDQMTSRAEVATMVNRMLGRGPLVGRPGPAWPDVPVDHWAYQAIEEASTTHAAERGRGGVETWTGDVAEETW